MLRFIFLAGFLCLSYLGIAQDTIVLFKHDPFVAKITEIGFRTMSYEVPGGPLIRQDIEDIKYIVLQNGTRMYRARDGKGYYLKVGTYREPAYGNNIISVAPVQLSSVGLQHGLAYERMLDSNGIFGLYLPFTYSRMVSAGSAVTIGRPEGPALPPGYRYEYRRHMATFSPTLKIYVTGSKGPAKYSAGVGVYSGIGTRTYKVLNVAKHESLHHLGFFVHNAVNLNASEDLYVSFEATTGYYRYFIPAQNYSQGRALIGAGFRLGYRF